MINLTFRFNFLIISIVFVITTDKEYGKSIPISLDITLYA